MPLRTPTARHPAPSPHVTLYTERFFLPRSGYPRGGAPRHHGQPGAGHVARSRASPVMPPPPLPCPRQGVLRLHMVLRGLAIAHEQRQVVQAQPPDAVPVTEAAHRLRQDIRTKVPMMHRDMRHPLRGVIILVDARTEGRQGRPQRRLERAQAGVARDGHIEDRLQPPGKNPEPGGDYLEGGRVRRERTQDGLYDSHLILFGYMVGYMRKRWDVHALEAKLILQTGPHGRDLGGMARVEKRDNAVHTSLLSVCSWETVALASPCVAAMPWPARARARPPPATVRPTRVVGSKDEGRVWGVPFLARDGMTRRLCTRLWACPSCASTRAAKGWSGGGGCCRE